MQLLHEFEKLPRRYQFDEKADWWKILGEKMNENEKSVEVCSSYSSCSYVHRVPLKMSAV